MLSWVMLGWAWLCLQKLFPTFLFLKFWKYILIQNKKLWGLTFLFWVNYLIGIFLVFKEWGFFDPPFWNFKKVFWFRIKSYGHHLFVSIQLVEWFRSYWHFLSFFKVRAFLTPLFEILKTFLIQNKKL